ncbi:MAG: hypothetical protein J6W42_04910 [Bacteroidaceae bacterium]|nr:hypothetical protein [Bacteroidaceae bacterium]
MKAVLYLCTRYECYNKITSLTDIEFMVGDEWGMNIEQIVPDEIPDDGTPEMEEIRRMFP